MSLPIRSFMIPAGLLLVTFLTLHPSHSHAQGGGGGFGGGGGGRLGAVSEGDSQSFTHILTPGDRGEWPLTARAGETVIVFVTSTTFDPAAQIVDKAGKVLAENDDIRPGLQDSLILFRFVEAGEYKILVKGFKSAAGGQYTISLRRFLPSDLHRGERNTGIIGRSRALWHRFSTDIGETLVVTTRSAIFDPDTEIYAPNGERQETDSRAYNSGKTVSSVFRSTVKGEFYLRVAAGRENAGGYAVTVASARVSPIAIGATSPSRHLNTGGLDIWQFTGTAGDLIRIDARAVGAGVSVLLRFLPPAAKDGVLAQKVDEVVTILPSDPKARGETIALLKATGSYQAQVSQPVGTVVDYTISCERAVRALAVGAETVAKLPIGGSDYWSVEGKAGQIIRIVGMAVSFDIDLELFNPRGERVESNDDGNGDRNALLTALLKETGRYMLRVHAYGDGGSGSYHLSQKHDPVQLIKIGVRLEGKIGAGSSDIWSFKGKAGQTVILSVRSRDFDSHVNVFGPDAIEAANDESGSENTDRLLTVHLPLNGVYTIWVSARGAGGKYILRVIDAD